MADDDDLLIGVPDGDDSMVTADDAALFTGQTPQAAADDAVEMEDEMFARAKAYAAVHNWLELCSADVEARFLRDEKTGIVNGVEKLASESCGSYAWLTDADEKHPVRQRDRQEDGDTDESSAEERAEASPAAEDAGLDVPHDNSANEETPEGTSENGEFEMSQEQESSALDDEAELEAEGRRTRSSRQSSGS